MHYSTTIPTLLLAAGHTAVGTVFNVTVGGAGVIAFTPNVVNAVAGDIIAFTFLQKNHTATQSSLAAPCVPLPGGFDTGFQPVATTQTTGFTVAELHIESTKPTWVFCRQANHCQQGMVFAVNPGANLGVFQSNAANNPFGNITTSASGAATTAASATSAAATTTSTTTATGIDHKIIVGGTGVLAFSPANISAAVGDTITFEFHQKNHTATASAFNTPCRALASTSTTGQIGFDSGFMPVGDNVTSGFPTYTVTVNDTNPIWAYCRQLTHCGQGMVFAANAVANGPKNFTAFQALAIAQNGTNTTTTTPTSGAVHEAHAVSYAPVFAAVLGAIALFA